MDQISAKLGALEEGMRWIKSEVTCVRKDIRELNQFKWRVAGGSAVLGIIVGFIGSLVGNFLGK